jgi:hypothetical protein
MASNSPVNFPRTMAVMAVLLFYAPKANIAAAQVGAFSFRFEIGNCLTERFDTSTGIFTKNLGVEPVQTVTARFSLTDAQMSAIYRTIERIRFVDYPSVFRGVRTDVQEMTVSIPYHTYRLEVRNAGVVHAVFGKDAYGPTTVEADRLRDLFLMIREFIHAHPEFKRLPPATVCCM